MDALGSVIAQSKDDQSIQNFYGYSAYGESQTLGPDEGNAIQYTGREVDGTGLMYYRARYYDSVLKRFVTEDPIGLQGGANFYSYVGGNPIDGVDPFGLVTWPTDYKRVTDPYASRGGTHNGVDIQNPPDGRVYSTQDGVITSVTSGGPGGNQIVILNSDGSVSGYAHTKPDPAVRPGQPVSEGQTIGRSDGSGKVTGPHLHYTYRPCLKCQRQDPMTQLSKGGMCTP